MAKRAEGRFPTASEVAQLLESCLAHAQRPTVMPLPGSLSRPRLVQVPRSRKQFFTGVLVMIVTVGLLAILAWQWISPPKKISDHSLESVQEAILPQQTEKRRPEVKPAPAVSDIDAGPVWGEAIDGLQLAVSGIRQDRHFKSGDTIRFRLSVRNVAAAIHFQYKPPKMCDWIAPFVEKANGERVKIDQMFFRGGHNHFTVTLQPKAEVSIHVSGILVLGASDTAKKTWPRIEKPEPGEYRLRGGYSLQRLDADGKEVIQRDADGKRTVKTSVLNSGTVAFHID